MDRVTVGSGCVYSLSTCKVPHCSYIETFDGTLMDMSLGFTLIILKILASDIESLVFQFGPFVFMLKLRSSCPLCIVANS